MIYMDNHATTPIASEVLEEMLPFYTTHFGNAASSHLYGIKPKEAVIKARQQVADLIGCKFEEVIFTSGATESNNLAIRGVAYAYRDTGNHIITSTVEHHAILDTCHALESEGFEITYLPVDRFGMVDPDAVKKAITTQTILVSIIYANNEVGTINPLKDIAKIASNHEVLFHSDAVQGIGKIESNMDMLGLDLASMTAHKIYGPKGVGALYLREGIELHPLFYGGGQENGIRSGTLNVGGIVGLGAACHSCSVAMDDKIEEKVGELRNILHEKLSSRIPDIHLNGHPKKRLSGNLHISFKGIQNQALMMSLEKIAVSAGSACDSESVSPSHVLSAMGIPDELALTAVRFGVGRYNTSEEIDIVADEVEMTVKRLRSIAPV
ncbi:cysteine desulfurase NifS [Candidatus Poribacteria bacterium]|nr:MAG: cysteine desulfurase NifS [Candidatus Poribacteria bacterium]